MINDNELRKGNWVIFDNTNKRHPQQHHVKVLELKEKEVVVLDPVGLQLSLFYQTNSIRPIPITPEVLEKCGFRKDNYGCFSIPLLEPDQLLWTKHYKSEIKSGWSFSISIGFAEDVQGLPDKNFIHEVQNLYFALTQTEIEYKP